MIYSYSDTVPAGTTYANRRKTVMKLGRGIIYKVEIQYPLGCGGLAYCCINRALTQVWPSNTGTGFAADGFVMSFDEHYPMLNAPYELEMYTWNLSTTHEHTITARIAVRRKNTMLLYVLPQQIKVLLTEKGLK